VQRAYREFSIALVDMSEELIVGELVSAEFAPEEYFVHLKR